MTDSMHLSRVIIKNFRSCYDTSVELRPALTLLVGENNAGKSNIIDALRLTTAPSSGRRTRYFEPSDRSVGREGEGIVISSEYRTLTEIQQAQYITALDLKTKSALYCTKFSVDEEAPRRSKPTYHAGPAEAIDVEASKRDQIRHVYLEPLRNAQRELDSSDGNRLARIVETLFTEDERKQFVAAANSKLKQLNDENVLTRTAASVQEQLTKLTDPVRKQHVKVSFTDQRLSRLARSLRLKMAEHNIDPANLAESGLGYANLLYMATVVLELRNADDAELTLFLVEEPEAHLHPQLQIALLDYLREVAEESGQDDTHGPAGRIQVVATTHSPNLASSIKVENVVVLRTTDAIVSVPDAIEDEFGQVHVVDKSVVRQQTVCVPTTALGLDNNALRKISQYLDVTKSALLFTRTVVLVEGIAEAVVLPLLARHCVLTGDAEEMKEKRRKFHATSILSVDGVDFEPYIQLLLGPVGDHSIVDKLVIITDGDPQLPDMKKKDDTEDVPDAEGDGKPEDSQDDGEENDEEPATVLIDRKTRLESFAENLGVADRLRIYASNYTFEADLAGESENLDILKACYLKQRPRSAKNWTAIASSDNPAEAFYRKLRANSKYIGKGEFAHDVALAIEKGAPQFKCPGYLRLAIESAVGIESANGTD